MSELNDKKFNKADKPNTTKILNSNSLILNSEVVSVSPTYFRPTEVDILMGNPAKAKEKLGWEAKVKFGELVSIMIQSDLEKVIKRGY